MPSDTRTSGGVAAVRRAFDRFIDADGFAHARTLAFQITLTAIPLFIAFVAIATALGQGALRETLKETLIGLSPGPTGRTVTQAFKQGAQAGRGSSLALWFGLTGGIASATTALTYVERACNRLFGRDTDRDLVPRYANALMLALSSGVLIGTAFVLFLSGSAVGEFGLEGTARDVWAIARWPVVGALATAGFVLVFLRAPSGRSPRLGSVVRGAIIATILWSVFSGLLALYLNLVRGFGSTYGSLSGIVGMLLWAFLSSLAIYLGLAYTAEVESA